MLLPPSVRRENGRVRPDGASWAAGRPVLAPYNNSSNNNQMASGKIMKFWSTHLPKKKNEPAAVRRPNTQLTQVSNGNHSTWRSPGRRNIPPTSNILIIAPQQ